MAEPINHSIGCYSSRCRNRFDNTSPTQSRRLAIEETHQGAGKAGWVMGLDSEGQAHYACPNHAGSLFDESPLQGWFRPQDQYAIARRRAP